MMITGKQLKNTQNENYIRNEEIIGKYINILYSKYITFNNIHFPVEIKGKEEGYLK